MMFDKKNKIIPMKISTMFTECLTYKQLQNYTLNKSDKTEHAQIYKHISTCELCACAVNGFAAIPFTSADVDAIHNQIDVRTNATHANPLTFAHAFILTASLISIFGFYRFVNSFSENSTTATNNLIPKKIIFKIPVINETKNESKEEVSVIAKTAKKIVNAIQYQKFERNSTITALEQLQPIKPECISTDAIITSENNNDDIPIAPDYNSDVIYIYDLKITDYNKLYFVNIQPETSLFKTYAPAFKENKESNVDDWGVKEQIITADRVLKDGLFCFNKQQFNKAVENFNLLIENNSNDVNALFYSALSYYNLNKTERSAEQLNTVLRNHNNVFYPEAQWYLALITLKTGDKESAKQQLETIVAAKGFYAKKAKQKLKEL
jgi:hypothetical protein